MADKSIRMHTPMGRAVYPRLGRPDTKYYDLGIYKANIMINLEEAKPLLSQLSQIFKEHTGSAPNRFDNTMWKIETDEEGNPANEVLLKIAIKNRMGRDGEVWDRKPKLFDAALKPCPRVIPFGGSELIVNFEIYKWDAGGKKGVSLQPVAVQIIKLVEGDQNAEGYGFTVASGGFEAADGDILANDASEGLTSADSASQVADAHIEIDDF